MNIFWGTLLEIILVYANFIWTLGAVLLNIAPAAVFSVQGLQTCWSWLTSEIFWVHQQKVHGLWIFYMKWYGTALGCNPASVDRWFTIIYLIIYRVIHIYIYIYVYELPIIYPSQVSGRITKTLQQSCWWKKSSNYQVGIKKTQCNIYLCWNFRGGAGPSFL